MVNDNQPNMKRGDTIRDKIQAVKTELAAATQDINNSSTVATLRAATLRYARANNDALRLIQDLLELLARR